MTLFALGATIPRVEFEFDPAKSRSNKLKHGLDFKEAQALWNSRRVEFPAHSGEGNQMRYAVVGTIKGIYYTAIITYRGSTVRIISVRSSKVTEQTAYEKILKNSP